MEKTMETTFWGLGYRVYIGVTLGVIKRRMETTIGGLGFRV